MARFKPSTRLLTSAILILGGSLAHAGDWPQWRGPERNGHVSPDVAVPADLPASPQLIWHKEIGFGLASPVVADGRVFYLDDQGDREVVHAADARSGADIWKADLDAAHHDSQSAPGPRTTPIYNDGCVYAQSCRGELKCLNATSGKVVWQKNYVTDFHAVFIGEKGKAEGASRHGNTATPLIDGDHLIAEVGGPGASIVCFDKKSGKALWTSQDDEPGYAPPILATVAGVRQFISFTAIGVVGLDPSSGKLLWRVPVKTALGRHATTPLTCNDTVVVSSHQAGLLGIKVKKSGDALSADIAWTQKESAINFASPVAKGPYLYGVGPRKNLICVEIETGKPAWSKDDFFKSAGGKAYAGMIVMGSNILVLTDDGQLVMFSADPKDYHEISRAQGCGTNWCNPAYADGKLYLRDAKELRCIKLLP